MTQWPWHTKLVLALLALLPVFFAVSALGTKFGVWNWQTGLLALTMGGGVILLGITALAALVSLILGVRARPRSNQVLAAAIIGLALPGAIFVIFAAAGSTAKDNPIHDVATDTANPPAFSEVTMAARAKSEANPLSDYQVPLGQLELYKDDISPELAVKSHAQIITARKDRPAPLPLAGGARPRALPRSPPQWVRWGWRTSEPTPKQALSRAWRRPSGSDLRTMSSPASANSRSTSARSAG